MATSRGDDLLMCLINRDLPAILRILSIFFHACWAASLTAITVGSSLKDMLHDSDQRPHPTSAIFAQRGLYGSNLLILLALLSFLSLPTTTAWQSSLDTSKSISVVDQDNNAFIESYSSDNDPDSADIALASSRSQRLSLSDVKPADRGFWTHRYVYYLLPQGRAPPLA